MVPDFWGLLVWSVVAGRGINFQGKKQLASLRHLFPLKIYAPPHALLTDEIAVLFFIALS
ncbi:hypothetical protein A8B84_06425 [Marinobacter sp. EhC06]|nr:hypothetical protein A8B80_04635 [Marinobacter sp. EhN04]OAN91246.1 hypothetical protein A8B84_06425 [Marinobacter sp. EhC06]